MRYYARELGHLRGSAHEFARTFPKIAGRLALDEFDCADPYVERLLEGFAFMAARVQLKIDAEFPAFIQHMLELVYPSYLAPLPSMAIVQFQPDLLHPGLAGGVEIPRGGALRAMLDSHTSTRCEFRTAHAMTLFPIEVIEAKAFPAQGRDRSLWGDQGGGMHHTARQVSEAPRGCIRLRLRTGGGRPFSQTGLDRLSLHLRGSDALPMRLYERLIANVVGVVVTPVTPVNAANIGGQNAPSWRCELPADAVSTMGFDDEQSLLPNASRTFSGYRLLQEYFALASRFLFVEVSGLARCLACAGETEIDIVFLLNVADPLLEQSLSASHFALHCTPAINLFSRRIDRVALHSGQHEHHVVADRTRPIDFEIHTVESVAGYAAGQAESIEVAPLFEARDDAAHYGANKTGETAYGASRKTPFYQIRRERRMVSPRAPSRRDATRSSYTGSEVFIALTDATQHPHENDDGGLQQLSIRALCTNRDLPLSVPLGGTATDFSFEGEAPLVGIRCVGGISRPAPSAANGATAWRLLNHLSLNYASLIDGDTAQGANALRDLLSLYCGPHDLSAARQVEGVRSITRKTISRRVATRGPMTFVRGIEVTVVLDEAAFEGGSAFLMGAVLARFFAQYVSVNSFVETVVRSLSRGEIMRWSPREGQCPIL